MKHSRRAIPGGRYHCSVCKKQLLNATNRCHDCYRIELDRVAAARGLDPIKLEARRRVMRLYMRTHRDPKNPERMYYLKVRALTRRPIERELCVFGECAYHGYDHAHCECGLAVAPQEMACPMCIAEQGRIEFKTWEEVA